MKKICGVYLIVSPSGKRYVGSSKDINFRKSLYNRLECKTQKLLFNSLKKYGFKEHKFTILYECMPDERLIWERLFGELYLSLSDFGGLNLNLPPIDSKPLMVSQEVRKQISISLKITNSNPETKNKKSEMMKERYTNPEYLKKHREMISKRATPEFRAKAKVNSLKQFSDSGNVKHMKERLIQYYIDNPEARLRASNKTIIQYKTTNIREILSKTANKTFGNPETHPRARKVINLDTGEVFKCAKIVAINIGMTPSAFTERLRGTIKNNTSFCYL